jgi:hemolysin activation/secretion protein
VLQIQKSCRPTCIRTGAFFGQTHGTQRKKSILIVMILSLSTWLGVPALAQVGRVASNAPSTDAAADPIGPPPPAQSAAQDSGSVFIQEYRVKGAHHLSKVEIEEAVYPFLGPGRTNDDVEQARRALEKAYHDKGYETIAVEIPSQRMTKDGVVYLHVIEATVGRLRVKGARYFSPDKIKARAPSLAEGKLVNFNEVPHDMIALNQSPDRQVTPALSPGRLPGTVDINLNVKDTLPVHGNLELNNEQSPSTTPLRVNGGLSDDNLWQLGHSAGLSFEIAPERLKDAEVFSAYYLVPVPSVEGMSLTVQGTKQNSNVSSLGGVVVTGRNTTVGLRAGFNLPASKNFYDSITLGIDYKQVDQDITIAGVSGPTPVIYYPLSASYSATLFGTGNSTELNAAVTFHLRGTGSSSAAFDNSRFGSGGSFIYFRGDLSHTHDLPAGLQIFGKIQGQLADQPLLSSEQFSAGGVETVRGYLEGEVPGDNAFTSSLELRSPSLISWLHQKTGEWRVYAFGDAGWLTIDSPLPGQASRFSLESLGVGSRIQLLDHFSGSIDVADPLTSETTTKAHDLRITFRAGIDY